MNNELNFGIIENKVLFQQINTPQMVIQIEVLSK